MLIISQIISGVSYPVFIFLQSLIENLKIQLDQFESEVELLSVGNKKKKMDKEVIKLWHVIFKNVAF